MKTAPRHAAVCTMGLILGVQGGGTAMAQAVDPQAAPAGDPAAALAAAQSLYEQATAEMDAGNYTSACPKLEEATRLVPEGLGAKLTLAACYEGQGRLASAWSQYALAAAMARRSGQVERAQRAEEKATALRPRLAMLTVTVPETARGIEGLSVMRDGIPLGEGQWAVPVPVDAGRHDLVVTAPGHKAWRAQVEVKADGEQAALEVQAPPTEAPKAPEPVSAAKRGPRTAPVASVDVERDWQRPAAIAAMGLGLAGLGVGAVLGGMTIARNGESNDGHCDAQDRCDAKGLDLREQALALGNGSTIALIAGGALAVGGVALWMTAPAAREQIQGVAPRWSTQVVLVPGGAQVRGRW